MICLDRPSTPPSTARGFTLLELLVVMVLLGILAAIVAPEYGKNSKDAKGVALMSTLVSFQTKVDIEKERRADSTYPPTVDPAWFSGNRLPSHPENQVGEPSVEVQLSGDLHPTNKLIVPGVGGAYWYNPQLGVVRARVGDQGSEQETLDFYNFVNQSSEASVGNYPGS